MSSGEAGSPHDEYRCYPMAPLIRFTLIALYFALVLPLPLLAPAELRAWMVFAQVIGLLLVWATTSQQVELDGEFLKLGYPRWCQWLLVRQYAINLSKVKGLEEVNTSQGGRVYYIHTGEKAGSNIPPLVMLPQRVDRFNDFLVTFSQRTGIGTSQVERLTPAWTYWSLAVLSILLLFAEIIVIISNIEI